MRPDQGTVKTALVHLGVTDPNDDVIDALQATQVDTELEIADLKECDAKANKALRILLSERKDAYEAALKELHAGTQEWWAETLVTLTPDPDNLDKDKTPPISNAEGLRCFLESTMLPWSENRKNELANRPLIREHAFGEALNLHKSGEARPLRGASRS